MTLQKQNEKKKQQKTFPQTHKDYNDKDDRKCLLFHRPITGHHLMVTMVMTKLVQQTSLSVTIQHQQIIAHVEIERHVETTKRRTNPECHMTADKESRRVGGGGW